MINLEAFDLFMVTCSTISLVQGHILNLEAFDLFMVTCSTMSLVQGHMINLEAFDMIQQKFQDLRVLCYTMYTLSELLH